MPKADLWFELGFSQPRLELLTDQPAFLQRLYSHLEPHGLKLGDVRVERGSGTLGENQIVCFLFNFWMTIRVRLDRVEVTCSEMPKDYIDRFHDAIVGTVTSIREGAPDLSIRSLALAVGLHAKLENETAKTFLARFGNNAPTGLGPPGGNGAVFYFGPSDDRLLSSVTADMSAVVPEGVYLRIYTVWDPHKTVLEKLRVAADAFTRQTLVALGLEPLA